MNLQDYKTPETDDYEGTINFIEWENFARSLERRLAACREFIREAIDMGHFEESHIEAAKQILEQTKP